MKIAPSILAADFANLLTEVKSVENADFLHIDVMDGHFVNNISLGAVVYKSLQGKTTLPFDVHLMICNPFKYYQDFIEAGANIITFHLEACRDEEEAKNLIQAIKAKNCLVGMSIKPQTAVKSLDNFISDLDLILIMSVEPGFGGQKFISNALNKIKYLSALKKEKKYRYLIEVDGGITHETARLVKEAGGEIIVAGTYIFKSPNRQKTIEELKKI